MLAVTIEEGEWTRIGEARICLTRKHGSLLKLVVDAPPHVGVTRSVRPPARAVEAGQEGKRTTQQVPDGAKPDAGHTPAEKPVAPPVPAKQEAVSAVGAMVDVVG